MYNKEKEAVISASSSLWWRTTSAAFTPYPIIEAVVYYLTLRPSNSLSIVALFLVTVLSHFLCIFLKGMFLIDVYHTSNNPLLRFLRILNRTVLFNSFATATVQFVKLAILSFTGFRALELTGLCDYNVSSSSPLMGSTCLDVYSFQIYVIVFFVSFLSSLSYFMSDLATLPVNSPLSWQNLSDVFIVNSSVKLSVRVLFCAFLASHLSAIIYRVDFVLSFLMGRAPVDGLVSSSNWFSFLPLSILAFSTALLNECQNISVRYWLMQPYHILAPLSGNRVPYVSSFAALVNEGGLFSLAITALRIVSPRSFEQAILSYPSPFVTRVNESSVRIATTPITQMPFNRKSVSISRVPWESADPKLEVPYEKIGSSITLRGRQSQIVATWQERMLNGYYRLYNSSSPPLTSSSSVAAVGPYELFKYLLGMRSDPGNAQNNSLVSLFFDESATKSLLPEAGPSPKARSSPASTHSILLCPTLPSDVPWIRIARDCLLMAETASDNGAPQVPAVRVSSLTDVSILFTPSVSSGNSNHAQSGTQSQGDDFLPFHELLWTASAVVDAATVRLCAAAASSKSAVSNVINAKAKPSSTKPPATNATDSVAPVLKGFGVMPAELQTSSVALMPPPVAVVNTNPSSSLNVSVSGQKPSRLATTISGMRDALTLVVDRIRGDWNAKRAFHPLPITHSHGSSLLDLSNFDTLVGAVPSGPPTPMYLGSRGANTSPVLIAAIQKALGVQAPPSTVSTPSVKGSNAPERRHSLGKTKQVSGTAGLNGTYAFTPRASLTRGASPAPARARHSISRPPSTPGAPVSSQSHQVPAALTTNTSTNMETSRGVNDSGNRSRDSALGTARSLISSSSRPFIPSILSAGIHVFGLPSLIRLAERSTARRATNNERALNDWLQSAQSVVARLDAAAGLPLHPWRPHSGASVSSLTIPESQKGGMSLVGLAARLLPETPSQDAAVHIFRDARSTCAAVQLLSFAVTAGLKTPQHVQIVSAALPVVMYSLAACLAGVLAFGERIHSSTTLPLNPNGDGEIDEDPRPESMIDVVVPGAGAVKVPAYLPPSVALLRASLITALVQVVSPQYYSPAAPDLPNVIQYIIDCAPSESIRAILLAIRFVSIA